MALLNRLGRTRAQGPWALALAAWLSATSCHAELDLSALSTPIVNGTASADGYLPAVGALVISYGVMYAAFCSGTLIGDTLVLTAAHCIADLPSAHPIAFYIGNDVRSMQASDQVIPVTSSIPHPSYVDSADPPGDLSDYYDIAVLKLSKAPTGITPLKMPKTSQASTIFTTGQNVLAMGYGLTDPNDQKSSGAKYQGPTAIAQVGSSEFWIYSAGAAQKCSGDSGGPTLINAGSTGSESQIVIGVASRAGEGCTSGSVETRVDSYLTWIHQQGTIPCGSGLSADCEPSKPKVDLGVTCKVASECKSNLCVSYQQKLFCSQFCTTSKQDCPSTFTCIATGTTGAGVCVKKTSPPPPTKKAVGETCAVDADCTSGTCKLFEETSICTAACTVADDCGSETLTCRALDDGSSLCGPPPPSTGADGGSSGGCSTVGPGVAGPPGPFFLALLGLALTLAFARSRPRR